jgi:hypothetical protein
MLCVLDAVAVPVAGTVVHLALALVRRLGRSRSELPGEDSLVRKTTVKAVVP